MAGMRTLTTPLPLIEARQVRKGPCRIVLEGQPYVVWHTGDRFVAASAVCPHRGADLSTGQVHEGCLRCPYHGWTVAANGRLFSPFEAKEKGHHTVYPLTERFGLLWLNGDNAHFEALERHGGEYFGTLRFAFDSPLHITVDGFCDGAHVPYVHARNGASPAQVPNIRFKWEEDDNSVTLAYDYAQRSNTLMSLFHLFRTTRWSTKAILTFNPIRVQYSIYWYLPHSGRILNGINGNTYYFYPAESGRTVAICLMFHRGLPLMLRVIKPIFRILLARLTRDLMAEDLAMASRILATDEHFTGARLESFDAPVVRVRKRLLETTEFKSWHHQEKDLRVPFKS